MAGHGAFGGGDYETALSRFCEAISSHGSEGKFYRSRSLCYSRLGQWVESAEDARTAVRLDPDNELGYIYLAVAFFAEVGR